MTLLLAGLLFVPSAFALLMLVLYRRWLPRSQKVALIVIAVLWLVFLLYLEHLPYRIF